MSRITQLRKLADLYRRVATIHTDGGRREDRVLLIMADRLEREAAELEACVGHRGHGDTE